MNVKIRLLYLGKKQVDLLEEIRKRGYKEVDAPTLSNFINHRVNTSKAYKIRELCDEILTQWEQELESEG